MVVGVLGGFGAAGEHAGEHAQPRADRREPEELEAGQGDEPGGEEDHSGGEQHHAHDRRGAEESPESGDREAPGHDAEEREPEARRGDVVKDGADGDRDEADDRQVQSGRDHRCAESTCGAAADVGREHRDGQDAVGREQEARDDGRAVEDVPRQVVERAEPREVQLPPQRIASGEDGDDDAGGEGRHGTVAEVVGMVTDRGAICGRRGDLGDARSFGCGEGVQRTLVLGGAPIPRKSDSPKPVRYEVSSRYADGIPQVSGYTAVSMVLP